MSSAAAAQAPAAAPGVLTPEQRAGFERDGYLVVPGALPPERVQTLLAAVDRLYEEGVREKGLSTRNHWEMRNCIIADDRFLDLLDWPATFPLVVELLNWNIQLVTSHLIVRPPNPPGTSPDWRGESWHRDGGASWQDMTEPHPRLLIKVAYWLTDVSTGSRGNIRFVPGSHRLIGPPSRAEGAPDPYGAVEITAKPGDAVLFEQRLYHSVSPNLSEDLRKSLFFGYGFRWLRPMDYVAMPQELLLRCDPIRRQLLGDARTQMGYYLNTAEDVPLRAAVEARDKV